MKRSGIWDVVVCCVFMAVVVAAAGCLPAQYQEPGTITMENAPPSAPVPIVSPDLPVSGLIEAAIGAAVRAAGSAAEDALPADTTAHSTVDTLGRAAIGLSGLPGPVQGTAMDLWSYLLTGGLSLLGGVLAENGRRRVARRVKAAPPGKMVGSWNDVRAAGLDDPLPEEYGSVETREGAPAPTEMGFSPSRKGG